MTSIKAFVIAIPLAFILLALLWAYEDSCAKRRFSWKGLGISLVFFGIGMALVAWLG